MQSESSMTARRDGDNPGLAASGSQSSSAGLAGWVLPSLSDWAFAAVLCWLFWGQAGAIALLGDGDAGWHIRLGEMFLANGRLPATDPFSFTMAGKQWFAWEWLADVVLGIAHQLDGLQGVVLLAGAVIALTASLLVRYMQWLRVNVVIAILSMLLICSVSTVHWLARPHMFTWGFLIVTLWLLEADRRRHSWKVWLLVPMGALWTNLHGGWVALIVTTGIFAVGTGMEDIWRHAQKEGWRLHVPSAARRYLLLCALCLTATVVNPYGIELHAHVGSYLQSDFILDHVQEFQSPRFRSESMRVLEVMIFASFFVAAFMVRRGEFVRPLLMAAWAHACLTSVRHAPLFAIVALPYIALEVTRLIQTASKSGWSLAEVLEGLGKDYGTEGGRASEQGPWLGWLPIAGLVLVAVTLNGRSDEEQWKAAFPEVRFPTVAVEALGERLTGQRVLTSDQWGDYLVYRLFPNYLTFIDGRSDFYAPEIRDDYMSILGSDWKAEEVLRKYDFQAALLPLEWAITTALKQSPDWRVVYDDGFAVYLEKRADVSSERTAADQGLPEGPGSSRDGVLAPEGILLGSLK
jgi:hypothetical protein